MEAKLRERSLLLEKLTELVPGVIYQYQEFPDGRWCFPYASEGIREVYETTPEMVRHSGEAVYRVLHPDDLEALEESIRRSAETMQPWHHVYRVNLPVRGVRWLEGDSVPEKLGDGSIVWHGYIRDISDRKKAEDMLSENVEIFRGLFDSSPIPILLADASNGRIVEVNAVSLQCFGYTRGEVIGRNTEELGIWAHPAQRSEYFRRVMAETSVCAFEAVMRTKSGVERVMLCNGTLLTFSGGQRVLSSAIDITDLRRAEAEKLRLQERLHQNQKFEALGTLAGGIAHDFNNILTAIINYTSLAKEDCEADAPATAGYLDKVLASSGRAKELVRQILLFSRAETGRKEPVRVQHVLKEALGLLRSTLPATASIAADIDPDAPAVLANPTQLHQVIMNLAINAVQSLRASTGDITIRLKPALIGPGDALAVPDLKPGPHIHLEVTDTGCGMNDLVVSRAFEPFFTTKPVGEGTGLGLAVVAGIVHGHNGAITVRSQPGAGTTVGIFIPCYEGPEAPPATGRAHLPRGHGEHILLVDDEKLVVESERIVLNRLGYTTTVFNSPLKALAHFQATPGVFEAAVLDYQMPEMNGVALAAQLRSLQPGMPVLIASGYTGSITAESLGNAGISDLIQKPFEIEHLANALASALDASPSSRRGKPSHAEGGFTPAQSRVPRPLTPQAPRT